MRPFVRLTAAQHQLIERYAALASHPGWPSRLQFPRCRAAGVHVQRKELTHETIPL